MIEPSELGAVHDRELIRADPDLGFKFVGVVEGAVFRGCDEQR